MLRLGVPTGVDSLCSKKKKKKKMPGARILKKHKSKRRNVVLICEGNTLKLMSAEGRKTYMQDLPSYTSTQEDTDS